MGFKPYFVISKHGYRCYGPYSLLRASGASIARLLLREFEKGRVFPRLIQSSEPRLLHAAGCHNS